MNEIKRPVGTIKFDNYLLDVYESLDEPLFRAADVADMIGYSAGNVWNMLANCEEDEKLTLSVIVAGQRRNVNFVTERGLYDILEQSRKPIARKWRRVINNELIALRKARNLDILARFEEWDHELDNIYFDEETGIMMESVTVQGGDVEQVPYRGGLF
jgi:hypothetical protein